MKCSAETVAALQLAQAQFEAAMATEADANARRVNPYRATQARCRAQMDLYRRLGDNAPDILHDLQHLARIQAGFQALGEAATR